MTNREKILELLPITLPPELREVVADNIIGEFSCLEETVGVGYTVEAVIKEIKKTLLTKSRKQELVFPRAYLFTVLHTKFGLNDKQIEHRIRKAVERSAIWHSIYVIAKTRWDDPLFVEYTKEVQQRFPIDFPFDGKLNPLRRRHSIGLIKVSKVVLNGLTKEVIETGKTFSQLVDESLAVKYKAVPVGDCTCRFANLSRSLDENGDPLCGQCGKKI